MAAASYASREADRQALCAGAWVLEKEPTKELDTAPTRSSMRVLRRSVHSDAWPSLLEAAQKRTCPETMYRVGMAYFRGGDDGAPSKDATAAKDYLQAAAELGHPRAQAALGNIYYDEMEALRSLAQAHDYQAAAAAHKWLSRASEQGELSATRTLVPLYITKGRLDLALRTFAVRVRQSLW